MLWGDFVDFFIAMKFIQCKKFIELGMAKAEPETLYRKPWEKYNIRFLPEQRRRIEIAARHSGHKFTHFVRDATMNRVIEIENEIRSTERSEKRETSKPIPLPEWAKQFVRKEELEEENHRSENQPAAAQTVIVNAGAQSANHLVAWVASAPHSIAREERMHKARQILKESVSDEEEQRRLISAFDRDIGESMPQSKKLLSWLTK